MSLRVLMACACACACVLGALADLPAEHRALAPPPPPRAALHPKQLAAPAFRYPEGIEEAGWEGIPPGALLDILPFPKHLVLLAAAAAKWLATHASLLLLGAVLTVGACTLTPFCHISVERFEQLDGLPAEYYRAARSVRAARRKYGARTAD